MIPYNYLLHYSYFFKYKQYRNEIKNLIEIDNDIVAAKTLLHSTITEHDNYITVNNIENIGDTFTSIDNLSLHHANDHLRAFEESSVQQQKDATVDALK